MSQNFSITFSGVKKDSSEIDKDSSVIKIQKQT